MERRIYNDISQIVRQSIEIVVHQNCNGWTAVNQGADVVKINNIQLLPSSSPSTITGDSVSIEGNEGEIYERLTLKVEFQTTTQPQLLIIQKIYAKHYN